MTSLNTTPIASLPHSSPSSAGDSRTVLTNLAQTSHELPPLATPAPTGQFSTPRESNEAVTEAEEPEEEEEADPEIGQAGTGAIVDMEVFGQLLEIVSCSTALVESCPFS